MWSKENEKLKLFRFLGDEFLWWFCSWYASQNFLWQVFLFLEIASLKSMLNYWTIPNLTISGTPNLSTRFLTFTGNALDFLYFGSKIRFQSHFISRGNNFYWTLMMTLLEVATSTSAKDPALSMFRRNSTSGGSTIFTLRWMCSLIFFRSFAQLILVSHTASGIISQKEIFLF